MHSFLRERGFNSFSISATRDGKSYEIDVLFPWNDHLFVFECKNRNLSNHHPIQSYYFRKERDASIKQLKRQLDALAKYPDLATNAGNVDPREMKIVPVVLFGTPYSEAGSHDGVYVADWSSVSRVFTSSTLKVKRPYQIHRKGRLKHEIELYRLWADERPSPQDLVRQFNDPVQIRILESRVEKIQSIFLVDEAKYGMSEEYRRGEIKLDRLANLLDFNEASVRKEDSLVRRGVAKLNKSLERKELINQTRSFREKKKRDS